MDSDLSDVEIDQKQHANLIDNVVNLTKRQHVKKPIRTEPTLETTEFGLVKTDSKDVGIDHFHDLTKALKRGANLVEIGKKVKKADNNIKTLPIPLEKPEAERVRRSTAYEDTCKNLNRWDAVVTSNRAAPHLRFPLNTDVNFDRNAEPVVRFRIKSDLEKELEKFEPKVETYDINLEEKKNESVNEIMMRRKEAAKLRARMSFKEAKARRQNKIKSKKYHRIQKREKIKKQMLEFERLQKENPEEALKKLEEIEKARAEERMSLRHKGTGQWARSKQVRAKFDKESRQVLAEQLTISRELTQKLKVSDSSDDETAMESSEMNIHTESSEGNPWSNGIKTENEIDSFISGYRKFWSEQQEKPNNDDEESCNNIEDDKENSSTSVHIEKNINKDETEEENGNSDVKQNTDKHKRVSSKVKKGKKEPQIKIKPQKTKELKAKATSDWEITFTDKENEEGIEKFFDDLKYKLKHKIETKYKKLKQNGTTPKQLKIKQNKNKNSKVDLSFPVQARRPMIDEELTINEDINENTTDILKLKKILNAKPKETKNVKPEKFVEPKPINPKLEIQDILNSDDEFDQNQVMAEAFEDEDITIDFNKEKKDDIEKNKPKDVNLTLPGWGSWGGKDIKVSKRKQRRFIVKMPKVKKRRDENKGKVIIYEGENTEIKSHLVADVPFPFQTVKDYEASMRAPIGNTFVPEIAYRRMIRPAVKTKMGTIIEPMTEDFLLKKSKTS